MILKVLGSAAGGGFPQWNCACYQCSGVRQGSLKARARSQTQIAVSANGERWHLLGASPDLQQQIEKTPELHPKVSPNTRNTPIQSVVLANADLDQILGLLLLREFQAVRIHSTAIVQTLLKAENPFFRMLSRVDGQANWISFHPGEEFQLLENDGQAAGLWVLPIALSTRLPHYGTTPARTSSFGAGCGLIVRDAQGSSVGYFPCLGKITPDVTDSLGRCSAIFVDGTFWSNDELCKHQPKAPLARDIDHLPLSAEDGPLVQFKNIETRHKYIIHVNNTNPVLDEGSKAYETLHQAGWNLAYDGLEVRL